MKCKERRLCGSWSIRVEVCRIEPYVTGTGRMPRVVCRHSVIANVCAFQTPCYLEDCCRPLSGWVLLLHLRSDGSPEPLLDPIRHRES